MLRSCDNKSESWNPGVMPPVVKARNVASYKNDIG